MMLKSMNKILENKEKEIILEKIKYDILFYFFLVEIQKLKDKISEYLSSNFPIYKKTKKYYDEIIALAYPELTFIYSTFNSITLSFELFDKIKFDIFINFPYVEIKILDFNSEKVIEKNFILISNPSFSNLPEALDFIKFLILKFDTYISKNYNAKMNFHKIISYYNSENIENFENKIEGIFEL